jgi:hypothetical protein
MSYIVVPSVTPNYGFTHQEMLDIISSELGNISIDTKITNWLNMVIIDLASKYVFGTLHKYDSKTTEVGIPDVTLADDFYWLKTIAIPTQSRKLYPEDEQRISEGYPEYRTLQGTITHYYLNGKKLGLWQVPSGAFSVDYSYQRRPIKLAGSADICDLPSEWHTLVIQKAITKGYSQEGNDSGFAISLQLEARLFKELQVSAYRRPDETFVFNSRDVRGRIARPRLPSNYPISGS